MAIGYLPKTVTKDKLFERATERFKSWAKLYADTDISAEYMYEDMSASCYSGDPESDFPDECRAETIRYQYKDGGCSFTVDGIEVEVVDLRDMRKDKVCGLEKYYDVCIPAISYTEDGNTTLHPIPNCWLYGSTSSEFNEGKEVHPQFINAAREYIKQHGITPNEQMYLE